MGEKNGIGRCKADCGEQGSRDRRMLPAALTAWASSLITGRLFPLLVAAGGQGGVPPMRVAVIVVLTSLAFLSSVAVLLGRIRRRRALGGAPRRWMMIIRGQLPVVVMAVVLSSIAALSHDLIRWRDAASVTARTSSSAVGADVLVSGPATSSDLRGADCQADVRFRSLSVDGTEYPSSTSARLFASGTDCAAIVPGALLDVQGVLQEARFGGEPLWLVAETTGSVRMVRQAGPERRAIAHVQRMFFAVTERLPDQGRVLVPGLTLGVLGQDVVTVPAPGAGVDAGPDTADGGGDAQPINATYAAAVKERFRRSGIIHLMAVSGGHFALVADLIRRLCARLLLHRRIVAAAIALAYLTLAAFMYPSDSVLRALVMGLFGAAALAVGRRGQSMSALCWTVLGALLVDPSMSASFGFALSCAAVLGIILFADPIAAWMSSILPGFIAEALAMTVAAQLFTMPIQILMEPELPLASIPANLMVAPLVGFATMAGLASLAISWLQPECGFALAWLAACGTQVMERCAAWLSSGELATIPWAGGVVGAALMLAAEGVVVAMLTAATRFMERRRATVPGLPGRAFRRGIRDSMSLWITECERMLDEDG